MSVKVAIIEDSKELADMIAHNLISRGMSVIAVANNGTDGLTVIQKGGFDVLLLDLVLPNIDGLTLIKNNIPHNRAYKVICFSAFGKETIVSEARELGVDYFMMKPVEMNIIYDRISQLCPQHEELLLDYFSPKLKGTKYLKDAAAILKQHPEALSALTKSLYPAIAQINGVSDSSIERSIRHAIDKAWQNGLADRWQSERRYIKPTIGELLEYLVNHCG